MYWALFCESQNFTLYIYTRTCTYIHVRLWLSYKFIFSAYAPLPVFFFFSGLQDIIIWMIKQPTICPESGIGSLILSNFWLIWNFSLQLSVSSYNICWVVFYYKKGRFEWRFIFWLSKVHITSDLVLYDSLWLIPLSSFLCYINKTHGKTIR